MSDKPEEDGSESDLPVDAVTAVLTALKPLDRETRMRVLASVQTLLRGSSTTPEPPPISPAPQTSPGMHATPGFFTEDRAPSAKHFILEKRPKTDTDRVACLAYYLTHFRKQPQFKTVDLSTLNTEAAQPKFSNAAQAVDNAVRNGIFISADRGTKQLSAAGELYVQSLPDYDAAKIALKDHRQARWRRGSQ